MTLQKRSQAALSGADVQARLAALSRRIIACHRCPRLVEHRERIGRLKKPRYADWPYWSRPVPGFGDPAAPLMIVGLAPAAHGGNRTGRVFTGDLSASFLFRALHEAGFANQPRSEHRRDGLQLTGAYLCAAVRCVPPEDRPTAEELHNCFPYLLAELQTLPQVKALLALGRVAFQSCLRLLEARAKRRIAASFAHGACYRFQLDLPILYASYHPSPRNTNTGRLSHQSLLSLLRKIRADLEFEDPA